MRNLRFHEYAKGSPREGFACNRFTARVTLPYIASMTKLLILPLLLLLGACSTAPTRQYTVTDDQMNELVMYTVSLADTPYHYGGNSVGSGFDCSGFVDHVYRHSLGISLPRTSRGISKVGKPVSAGRTEPG